MRRTIRLAPVNVRTSESGVAAATIQAVTRRYGRRWALRGVSLSVAPGEIVGIEGHNGSGKSTLLRILSTAIKPTSGEARVYGAHVGNEATTVRGLVSLLTHFPGLYDDLTAEENLKFTCRMLGRDFARVPIVLERVGLLREAMEPVRSFSAGMQRRLSLARHDGANCTGVYRVAPGLSVGVDLCHRALRVGSPATHWQASAA